MTDEQINITIAEACGIVDVDQWGPLYKTASGWVRDCLDYCNDLNAMHEAEKVLEIDQQYVYGEELRAISGNVGPCGGHFIPNGWGVFRLATATPRERSEAFLRTLGKWEEVQP